MATKRATNGHDATDTPPIPVATDLLQGDRSAGVYVGFEQLVGTLMWAGVETELLLYAISSALDTTTLERVFTAACVPASWEQPYGLHADLSFGWPAEYTTLSLFGDEAVCSLYHSETDPCTHQVQQAEMIIGLEVTYHLSRDVVRRLDSDEGIERMARQVRQVFAEVVDHDNIVDVEITASYASTGLQITAMSAHYFWYLGAELRSPELLGQALLSLCHEIEAVLSRFAREFPVEESR